MALTATARKLPVLALAVSVGACSGGGLGGLGDILMGGGQPQGQPAGGTLTAEVQEVREQQQQIIVRTEQGQQGAVLFDANTQVIYQNQQYPVNALERGDIVDLRVQEIQQGLYTDLIQVRQSVQERQGGTTGGAQSNVYEMEGTIGQIDLGQWMFTLNMTQGGTVAVYLPSNAPASARDQLRRYRAGDYVRVQIRPIDQERAELVEWGWDGEE